MKESEKSLSSKSQINMKLEKADRKRTKKKTSNV